MMVVWNDSGLLGMNYGVLEGQKIRYGHGQEMERQFMNVFDAIKKQYHGHFLFEGRSHMKKVRR